MLGFDMLMSDEPPFEEMMLVILWVVNGLLAIVAPVILLVPISIEEQALLEWSCTHVDLS